MSFLDFCNSVHVDDDQRISIDKTLVITFTNRKGSTFQIEPSLAIDFLKFLNAENIKCIEAWQKVASRKEQFTQFEQDSYRAIFQLCMDEPSLNAIATQGKSQTRQLTVLLSKIICYFGKLEYEGINLNTHFDQISIEAALKNIPKDLDELAAAKLDNISINFEEEFGQWMKVNGLSEATITRYMKDAPKFIDALVKKENIDARGLLTIEAPQEIQELSKKLEGVFEWQEVNRKGNSMYKAALNKYGTFLSNRSLTITLPKPFLLLAGISGTGKSRFVRKQAEAFSSDGRNFCLIPVRPDWHEPSDLLGYVSRIPTEQYVASPFLKFIVKAWIEACESVNTDQITLKPLENIAAYWACLDEMNLAPVEQYFADYLAVLETREWTDDGKYKCNALVHPAQLLEKDDLTGLQKVLGLGDHNDLWDHFKTHGIPIPPNLIVAGTVNMDETTHGFSRKVIDRAFTIDFGAFFPNEFDKIFEPQLQPKSLTFSRYSRANRGDLANVAADTDGSKSITFLKEVNDCLKATPFELAYRALNELLLAVKCFAPKDDLELSAVWDDFLMTKLLPRIEGDSEKLNFDGTDSLLTKLQSKVKDTLNITGQRPDLLRTSTTGGVIDIEVRSIQKLQWMQDRLVKNNFTSFWP